MPRRPGSKARTTTRPGIRRERLLDDRATLEQVLDGNRHGKALLVGEAERPEVGQGPQPKRVIQHLHARTA
jgi:hypothetical protein